MDLDENTMTQAQPGTTPVPPAPLRPTKFCSHCGKSIDAEAVVCPLCGCQVKDIAAPAPGTPSIVINNTNTNTNANVNTNTNTLGAVGGAGQKQRNKWVALGLCGFLGVFGAHKFYEGKTGMGILYLCTFGLMGIGIVVDFISLLLKPNPYYV